MFSLCQQSASAAPYPRLKVTSFILSYSLNEGDTWTATEYRINWHPSVLQCNYIYFLKEEL